MSEGLGEKRRKFIEVILTLGTLLGVIAAIDRPNNTPGSLGFEVGYALAFVIFVLSCLATYSHLAFGFEVRFYRWGFLHFTYSPYAIGVKFLSAAFAGLIILSVVAPVFDSIEPFAAHSANNEVLVAYLGFVAGLIIENQLEAALTRTD